MLNLTTAIYSKLSGSSLETAIGGRMFKGRASEGADYPFIVFFVVTNRPEKTFSENYEDVIIQFSLFSSTSGTTEIENMYTHLKALYDECVLSITGATLIWMKRDNAVFLVEDHTTPSGTAQVYAYHIDYSITTLQD